MQIKPEAAQNTAAALLPKAYGSAGLERCAGTMPGVGSCFKETLRAANFAEDKAKVEAVKLAPSPDVTSSSKIQSDGSFGFLDLVDMVNPLQHIPLVNMIYRGLTGDEIKPISQIIGGAAFGGPLGAAGGIASAIVKNETGKDLGAGIMASAFGASVPENDYAAQNTVLALGHMNSGRYNG